MGQAVRRVRAWTERPAEPQCGYRAQRCSMLVVVPVYGTEPEEAECQGGRRLYPDSAPCPQHTHKLSSFLCPVLRGTLGGLRWCSQSRGAARSPDSWHSATAAPLQSPWLVTRLAC